MEVKRSSSVIDKEEYDRFRSTSSSTGGEVTQSIVNPTTHFNVAAGSGYIINHTTIPSTKTYLSWDAFNEVVATNTNTGQFTRIELLANGTLSQTNAPQTDNDRLTKIQLGILIHETGGIITNAFSAPTADYNHTGNLRDLAEAIGTIVKDGLVYAANGANLFLNRSAGSSYVWGRAYGANKNFPSNITNLADLALNFYYNYRNGSGGFTTTALTNSVNPNQWDNGSGTLQNIISNKWTIQYIYFYPEHGNTFIMYGQNVYGSQAEAISAIGKENISHTPRLFRAAFRAALVMKQGITVLNDPTHTTFLQGGKFGNVSPSSSSFSTITDLQSAYNASVDPEIILNNAKTNPAFSLQDSVIPLAGDLFEIKNNSGVTIFSVNASGINISNVLTKTNTEVYTPTLAYHPATKKYVDDNAVPGGAPALHKLYLDEQGNVIKKVDLGFTNVGSYTLEKLKL